MSSPQKVDRERERSWLGTMEAKVALGVQGIDSNGEAVVDKEYVVGIYRPCGRWESGAIRAVGESHDGRKVVGRVRKLSDGDGATAGKHRGLHSHAAGEGKAGMRLE